ncbi:effector-associated domain 2-containing protein [Streptomyces thermocarboxydovorans]|uniref:VMAP-C domain-containing protein n=1 Tax=Streptomyces thermocarboxydovorans TaxID=59298 RepID=UPI0031CF6697
MTTPDAVPGAVHDPESAARLADALMKVSVLDEIGNRRLCVIEAMERLRERVSVPESPEKKIHVIAMVRAFAAVPRGWRALTEAVQYLADYDLPSRHAASLAHTVALPVFEEAAEQALRGLLAGLDRTTVPELDEVYRAAAGPFGPLPPGVNTAWEAHQLLAHTNWPADGVPPAVRFLTALASVLSPERGEPVRDWVARQVRDATGDPALACRMLERAGAGDGPLPAAGGGHAAYVVIRLCPSVSTPDRVDVTCWTSTGDTWEPRRRDDSSVPRDRLRRHVAALVDREEARLCRHRGGIVLEFVLPLSLLNEPVEQWCRNLAFGDEPLWDGDPGGPPFWQDYPVVVRSLERIEALQLHRVWNERWDVLATGTAAPHAYRCVGDVRENYPRLKQSPDVVLMTLGAPPDRTRGREELYVALHAGLPVLVWNHTGPLGERVGTAVEATLDGPCGQLLDRMVRLRSLPETQDHEGSAEGPRPGLAVLWDDPNRLPEFPEPVLSGKAAETYGDTRTGT